MAQGLVLPLKGSIEAIDSGERIWVKWPSCFNKTARPSLNGFPYNLAEVFGISRECVARKIYTLSQGQGHAP